MNTEENSNTLTTISLSLDVTYQLNGITANEMVESLSAMIDHHINRGMLTADTAAEVEDFTVKNAIAPEPLDEDELSSFFAGRIDDGDIEKGDIPVMLLRFGLQDRVDFINEMRERITIWKDEESDD